MKYLVLCTCIFLAGCEREPEIKYLTPIVSDKDKIGIDISTPESLAKYTSYLDSRFIPYEIDQEFPLVVWWYPYNSEHQELIMREAFGIPANQIQKIFKTKEEATVLLSVLSKLDVEHATGDSEDGFVILYFPVSEKQKKEIDASLSK